MAPEPQPAGTWLTRQRLWVHGLVLALCLWSTYAWIMSAPGLHDRNGIVKGADFLHFYTLGILAGVHRGSALYNMQAQSASAEERVPEAGHVYFIPLYPPQVSLLFVPFAALPYSWALLAWVVCSASLYVGCCWLIWRTCRNLSMDGALVLLLAFAYPAFFHVIVWGQTSVLAFACFTLAYLALRSGRRFAAGLAIGLLMFKPQLGIVAAFVLVSAREWEAVGGALSTAAAQLLAGWAYYGSSVMRDYWEHLTHASSVMMQFEPRPYQMHSLRAFWTLLVPWPKLSLALWTTTAAAASIVALLCWRRRASLPARFSVLLIATVLVSPHLTVYDLTILAPAFLLLADEAVADGELARKAGTLLYACYVLPLVGPLSMWTHLQLSVPAMAALLWVVYRFTVSTGEDPSARWARSGQAPSAGSGQAARRSTVSVGVVS